MSYAWGRGSTVRTRVGGHGQGDDVVHLHGEDGQPEARALPAERLVAQHLGTHGLRAGGPVDAARRGRGGWVYSRSAWRRVPRIPACVRGFEDSAPGARRLGSARRNPTMEASGHTGITGDRSGACRPTTRQVRSERSSGHRPVHRCGAGPWYVPGTTSWGTNDSVVPSAEVAQVRDRPRASSP